MSQFCIESMKRKYSLVVAGIQVMLNIVVISVYMVADLGGETYEEQCIVEHSHVRLVEVLHIPPFLLSIILTIGVVLNNISVLRFWFYCSFVNITMMLVMIIFSVQGLLSFSRGWYFPTLLFVETFWLVYSVIYINKYTGQKTGGNLSVSTPSSNKV